MEKLSGLVLDIYDDPGIEVFQTIFPDVNSLPEIVKEAHLITSEEYQKLPDEAFALVLVDGDTEMRKFATIDAGNTALSVEYFLKTAHKLPVEAQKVAAQNLIAACGWYGIDPPELLKEAAVPGARSVQRVGQLLSGSRLNRMSKKTEEYLLTAMDRIGTGLESKRHLKAADKVLKMQGPEIKAVRNARLAATGIAGAGTGALALAAHKKKGSMQKVAMNDWWAGPARPVEKTALDLQKMKKNMDDAPSRPDKIQIMSKEDMKKSAMGVMPLLMGAMTAPSAARQAKTNLQGLQGTGGQILTPQQMSQRGIQMGAR